jgi:hypothetical protein
MFAPGFEGVPMRILMFVLVMALSVTSCWLFAQAFVYPEYGIVIFGGGIIGATIAFALASRWNRA